MREACLEMVYELAKKDKRIFFIGSDLGVGTLKKFKEEMPERFFMEGVSEANLIGMAAGLAMEGKIVYANTIATFLTRRCFEQIVLDLCLHNLKVRLIANGGGLVYAPLGPTHLAIDDIAILRAIPHMSIVAPSDAEEMKRFMPQTVDYPGPMYIRLAKGYDPVVSSPDIPFKIGKVIVRGDGKDALIITTGIGLKLALDAQHILKQQNTDVTVVHAHTVKPLDVEAIKKLCEDIPIVVTVEEHTLMGGLGSAVAEIIAEASFQPAKKFKRLGIPDAFAEQYGSQNSLMKLYDITTDNIVATVKKLQEEPANSILSASAEDHPAWQGG